MILFFEGKVRFMNNFHLNGQTLKTENARHLSIGLTILKLNSLIHELDEVNKFIL